MRGANFIVLLGRSVAEGIVGLGPTVPAALRAFELQYLRALSPPDSTIHSSNGVHEAMQ